MKKVVVISAVVVLVIVAGFFLFGSVFSTTGNLVNIADVEYNNQKCVDGDGSIGYEESLFIKSKVTVSTLPAGVERGSFEDECSGPRRVQEYACTDSASVKSRKMHCLNGCVDGACIR